MELKQQRSQSKVLIIDDDPEMRFGTAVRLKANNYAVGFAFDGLAAINQASSQNPDVILLDLGLPAADGFKVMERLRRDAHLAGIPVIVVSGRDGATHGPRSLKAGARMFLQKPVRNADLLLAIEQVLGTVPPAGPVASNGHNASGANKYDDRPDSLIRFPAA